MKKILTAIVLMASVNSAYASCAKIDQIQGLTNEVRQEMKVQCETKKLELAKKANTVVAGATDIASQITNPEALTEWGQVATEFAKALGLAARELGIATNDFLQTPAGMLTASLIIWHVAGESLLGVFIGVPLLIFWLWTCLRLWRKAMIKETHYTTMKTWYGAEKRVVDKIEYSDDSEDRTALLGVVGACAFIGSAAILGWVIF